MPVYELDGIRPKLPASGRFWIAPDAVLIGNVELEEEASVWFQAVLRGDNERIRVGKRSNVQDGAIFHTDPGFPLTVGESCTIGHHAIVHGCTIGPNSLIGMGATVLNRARIGADSMVGANALVTEGKEFPDGSLIMGAPARAVRALDADAIALLRGSAAHYVENWKRMAARLKRID